MEKFWKTAVGVSVVMCAWLGIWNVVYALSNWIPVGFAMDPGGVRVMPSGIIGWIIFLIPALVVGYEMALRRFWPDKMEGFWGLFEEGPGMIVKRAPILVGAFTWLTYPLWNGVAFGISLIAGVLITAFLVYVFIGVAIAVGLVLFVVGALNHS